jgi:hypothetical protein
MNDLKKDWLIIDYIKTDISINKTLKTKEKENISNLSTKGKKSIQYTLTNDFNKKNNLIKIRNLIENLIKKNLNKNFNIDCSLKLMSAWTVLGEENSYHTVHNHNKKNLNYISTVTYLNVPKKDKGLFYYFFQDKEDLHHRIIDPCKNMIIIMPSWIYHGVYPQGKGLRQTLNLDFEYIVK